MCSLKAAFSVPDAVFKNKSSGSDMGCSSPFGSLQYKETSLELGGKSKTLASSDQKGYSTHQLSLKASTFEPLHVEASATFGQSLKWWEKSSHPNMIDVNSAQELVDLLLYAVDNLVVVEFYSPGCGACKVLHPKICQFAEMNTDTLFLKVNYEKHKQMCQALHVHVLPFFRFYRGAEGRLCSFSCTNATIKKFKDALAKHGTERCSLGPTKGLDGSELLSLASIHQISIADVGGGKSAHQQKDVMGVK